MRDTQWLKQNILETKIVKGMFNSLDDFAVVVNIGMRRREEFKINGKRRGRNSETRLRNIDYLQVSRRKVKNLPGSEGV